MAATLRGFARSQGAHDLQLQTFDGQLHLLLEDEYNHVLREKRSLMPAFDGTPQQYLRPGRIPE